MSHPFGDLLRQYCARKQGLSRTRLAHIAGYDQAVLARMSQGGKDLTGPSGRERVVRILGALREEGVLHTLAEANALLKAAGMPPLYEGQPAEAALLATLRANQPPSSDQPATPHFLTNLPALLTRFIGRGCEIAQVTRLLETTRLATLTGAGGCGKTRLVIQVGMALTQRDGLHPSSMCADGVWLAELASLSDPALVAESIVASLRLPPSNRPAAELLADYFRARRLLLILDNCEHLIDACAALAEALLHACPHLRILATSREALNVSGEVVWRVPSLAAGEAVLLFEQRASAAKPDFALTGDDHAVVTDICARLDGIPLAIELAATRVATLSLEQIAARLDDRFRLLTSGGRTVLPRHRTLRALIDWSYELLSEGERALLCHLSVFAGGWTLEAAEAMWGRPETLDLLGQLVNKSLVFVDQGAGQPRYRMLETIRQYAYDRLVESGEQAMTRQAHLQYFAGWAGVKLPVIPDQQKRWLDALEVDMDNLRAALNAAIASDDPGTYGPFYRTMLDLWAYRGYTREGITWIDAFLAQFPASATEHVTLLLSKSYLATKMGDFQLAYECDAEGYALALHLEDEWLILCGTAHMAAYPRDCESGKAMLEKVLRMGQHNQDRVPYFNALYDYGNLLRVCGEFDRAQAIFEEGISVSRDMGMLDGVLGMLLCLGILACARGNLAEARALLESSLTQSREIGDRISTADALVELAAVQGLQGDYAAAAAAVHEALETFRWVGNTERVAQCVCVAAGLARLQGQAKDATRLLAATADAYAHKSTLTCVHITFYDEYERLLAALRAELDPARFEQDWAEGCAMSLNQAAHEVLARAPSPTSAQG